MSITAKPELVKDSGKISYIFKFLANSNIKYTVTLTDLDLSKTSAGSDLVSVPENVLKKTLGKNENKSIFHEFLQKFIDETSQYFSKKYTVDTFLKILNNSIKNKHEESIVNADYKIQDTLTFSPDSMIFMNQNINLVWTLEHKIAHKNILITLPDIKESNDSGELLEINDINDLNEYSDNFEMPYEQLSREVALSKVREARLKAKLAYVQAQISTDNYLKKYGGRSDEFEDSDFDEEEDDKSIETNE